MEKTQTIAELTFLQQSNHHLHKLTLAINNARPTENIFLSPFSIYMALAILAEGLSGESKAQLTSAFGYTPEEVIPASALKAIQGVFAQSSKTTALNLGNSAWVQQGEELNQDYAGVLEAKYQALIEQVDFSKKSTVGQINSWIEKNTGGMIKDMLQSLDASTVLVLVNAIYFKALWQQEFKNALIKQPFHLSEEAKVTVSYMAGPTKARYSETEESQFVMIPYKDCSMHFIAALPKQGYDPVAQLSLSDAIGFSNTSPREVVVTMPKFSFESKTVLNNVLTTLGVTDIFNPTGNDFAGILPGDVHVSEVIHQAKIEVDRKGTKAAAATVVKMRRRCAVRKPKRPSIKLDRPFAFFIFDSVSNLILFSGIYRAPADEGK